MSLLELIITLLTEARYSMLTLKVVTNHYIRKTSLCKASVYYN